MCNVVSLNYSGPNYSTVKKDHKKGVQFILGEHSELFLAVMEIYRKAKVQLGITGPVSMILAEDETKVRGRIAYEPKLDSLVGFCGPTTNHVCVLDFKPTIGSRRMGTT